VDTGLLWFVNRILHAFGLAICYEVDDTTGEVTGDFYIGRTIFRGFSENIENDGYAKVAAYLRDNSKVLYTEGAYEELEPADKPK
jgi:N-dimethylarginine dimethylaminohydrolase